VRPRIPPVSVHDLERAPVPELQVQLSQSILMVAGDDDPALFTRDVGRHIQRPLRSGRFDGDVDAGPVRPTSALDDASVLVERYRLACAERARELQCPLAARYGGDDRTGGARQAYDDRAEEPDADDGDTIA